MPPLCDMCTAACQLEGFHQGDILREGLRLVNKVDGGLTTQRWAEKALQGQEPEHCTKVRSLVDP